MSSTCRKCGRRGTDGYCRAHRPAARPRSDYRRHRSARLAIDDGRCWLCGSGMLLPGEVWSADHVVPQADGGEHTLANLRRAHTRCNERRGCRVVTDELRAELRRRRRQDEFSGS